MSLVASKLSRRTYRGNRHPLRRRASGRSFNYNLRFPGQYYMAESGLFYNYFRTYDPSMGRYIESDPIGLLAGVNTYTYVSGNPVSRIDPYGLSSLIYNPSTGVLTVVNGNGVVAGVFPAANNAQSTSNGPWPPGAYSYNHNQPHSDDGPDSAYGSYGNFQFNVPGRTYMGVHSGRVNTPDKAGRKGYQHATDGCIRTTDAATELISQLVNNGDPLTGLLVTSAPVPTNIPGFDADLPGVPPVYLPDVRP